MVKPLLALRSLDKRFGGVHAVKALSLDIYPGEVVGLIGPNGSGKSTTVNLISGATSPTSGSLIFNDHDITATSIVGRVAAGLARTFQTTTLFGEFSLLDHVALACHSRYAQTSWADALRRPAAKAEFAKQMAKAESILDRVGLAESAQLTGSEVSSAQQRLLMIATALATEPKLLLLDEPAAGMVAKERAELSGIIRGICGQGIAVMVIEHHMALIMEVCERIAVLNFGQKIADDLPELIRADPAVIEAYLGASV
ncbi:branched-chain amino acid transport system ATP-binding protein [Jezberella montanilacus]|jgi:ABC-type branched-subunit amino acid transport system ATPase component|uniref:Branched-chain amino acid transport system ATP-binding protein n=1 Tax=Jezberella montanilacus TaxID=323426 RepID=A0A2T0XK32_9BURK|nr:branched-chain amino acid transport system ATP-binding protein [Jezberella montanilacus]